MKTGSTTAATKRDLTDLEKRLKSEILDGVAVLNENLLHNFQGAFKDRTELLKDKVNNHGRRIVRIETFLNFFPES